MSGGSYDYLFIMELDKLVDNTETIQRMADRLAGLGYARDAARETQELLLTIRQFANRIDVMQSRLAGVWKAVEWWDSRDSSEDQLKAELESYRQPKQ